MTVYQLISFKLCPWVQRAAIVLREKGVAFELIHIEADNRPDWFAGLSPHGKVPVLRIGESTVLFESNAICEYLEEVHEPYLHPSDPLRRAINRAWAEYLPAFAAATWAVPAAEDEPNYRKAVEALRSSLRRLEEALDKDGPFFNGQDYSLVDAGFAPFFQRLRIADDMAGQALLTEFPKVDRWSAALVARPSTHSFPPDEFEALHRDLLVRRGSWLAAATTAPG